MRYPDGWGVHAVHGIRVPWDIIEQPESITVERITREPNAEVRRVMTDIFTPKRFLMESGSVPIHADDYGTLYRAEFPDDEPLVMVEVINSTVHPDQTRPHYFLRVPPDMTTARQAIAWTFGKEAHEYAPVIET